MSLQSLVREEPILTLLTIQRRSVVNHLRVNLKINRGTKLTPLSTFTSPSSLHPYLHFVYQLHVTPQLVQVLNVAVTDLADDKGRLVARRMLSRFRQSLSCSSCHSPSRIARHRTSTGRGTTRCTVIHTTTATHSRILTGQRCYRNTRLLHVLRRGLVGSARIALL